MSEWPVTGLEYVARVFSAANLLADAEPKSRIAVSWRRCLIDHKLDPAQHGPPQTFTESEIKHFSQPIEELIQVAIPELEDLARVFEIPAIASILPIQTGPCSISRLPGGDYERVFRDLKYIYWLEFFGSPMRERMGSAPRSRSKDRSWCSRDEHFREQ